MSDFTKLPFAKVPAVRNDVFWHEYVLTKTSSCLVTSINISNRCADVFTDTEELISNEQGSANENLSQELWNSTKSRTVIIWDESGRVTPPQEVEYVRIH